MKSNNWIDLDEKKIKSNEYFNDLIKEFPILKKEIEDEDTQMIHYRMEIFSNYNIEQIKTKNFLELKRCFEFQESKIDSLNSKLINALNVSYCESLLLGECADEMFEIKKLMTPKLKFIFLEYEEYYKRLTNQNL